MTTAEIFEIRPAAAPGIPVLKGAPAVRNGAALLRLFALDGLPAVRHPRAGDRPRDADGSLACPRTLDMSLALHR
jgi:hypothetical protein